MIAKKYILRVFVPTTGDMGVWKMKTKDQGRLSFGFSPAGVREWVSLVLQIQINNVNKLGCPLVSQSSFFFIVLL